MRPLKHFSGIRIVRFKLRLTCGDLTLRRYRFRDTSRFYRLFRREFPQAGHSGTARQRPLHDKLLFCLWLHRTFQWVYIITRQTHRNEQILGFIGVYDLVSGRRAKLSIMIFDPLNRGLGYGTQALRTLLADFRRRAVLKSIRVRISRRNSRSLALFHKLGFALVDVNGPSNFKPHSAAVRRLPNKPV